MKKGLRIIISVVLFLIVFIFDKVYGLAKLVDGENSWLLPFFIYLSIYILIGYDIIFEAIENIFHGEIFDENFLMTIATMGAFALAIFRGVNGMKIEGFDEACAVLLLYQIGEHLQDYATDRSRKSISTLMDIRPDYANLKEENGSRIVKPEEVKVEDIIIVKPGERIPLDGVIIKGKTTIDAKALNGEALPIDCQEGSTVLSGTVNLTAVIEVRVVKEFYASTVSKILDLVEKAADNKTKAENFITKFSRLYTPIVILIALLLTLIPGLITHDWDSWIYRSLNFLVVSCPCALVISIPLSFFVGIGVASRNHILIKGSSYLEQFSKIENFVFDKTGTLTKGNFAIEKYSDEETLRLAAIAEQDSHHPIAKAILASYSKKIPSDYVLEDHPGYGIIAQKSNDLIYCGNEKMMQQYEIDFKPEKVVGTIVYVALNKKYKGFIHITDEIKPEAITLIDSLNKQGINSIMLTGDNETMAAVVANKIGLSSYRASLLPQDKVDEIEIIKQSGNTCFVGDGINDAPVIMQADIGIAMGALGSDAAIEAADIVLMKDNLEDVLVTRKISKRTMKIVFENIVLSILIKVVILVLSALGFANMWMAVIGDVGVTLLAVLNAFRINLRRKLK